MKEKLKGFLSAVKRNITVTASVAGGTLVWNGKSYPLQENEPIILAV